MQKKVIVITGQTATGKTKLALSRAQRESGEIVNFDARQVYQYLDVISGKDLPNEKFKLIEKKGKFNVGYYQYPQTKLWLYDIIEPRDDFSSFDFQEIALPLIKEILGRDKTPILVGGSYFYLYHLLYELSAQSHPANWALREQLNKLSVVDLQTRLKKLNLDTLEGMNQSDRQNPRRLIRRIEILEQKSESLAHSQSTKTILGQKLGIEGLSLEVIGIAHNDTSHVRALIEKRVKARIKAGAYAEVEGLIKRGYTLEDHGLKTIGYQQVYKYLKGDLSEQEAISEWTTREVQYAKRQLTFMKKDQNIKWQSV